MTTEDPPTHPPAAVSFASDKIRFDRCLCTRTLALAILFSWPLLLFGRPAYFSDSATYYKGGQAAVEYAVSKIMPVQRDTHAPTTVQNPTDVAGARSIPYCVTAYLLSGSKATMLPLVILQIVLVAFTIAVLLAALGLSNYAFAAVAVLLAFATPAAWFTSCAMPDIFAGVSIIVIAVMIVYADRLTWQVAIPLGLTGSFAIASHPSHVALALVLLPAALFWRLWAHGWRLSSLGNKALRWAAGTVMLAILVTVISGLVGFGEVSLAPRHFPLALARSINDGPARWYLDRHCRELDYVVCRLYPNGVPETGDEFLWGPNGIRKRASAAQMYRIRREEGAILLATAAAFPSRQWTDAIGGTASQLITFAVYEADFNVYIVPNAHGGVDFKKDPRISEQELHWTTTVSWISTLLATAGVIVGLITARGDRRVLTLVLLTGLMANAAICAIFSGVADRYQARVIWLLPLAAIAALAPVRRDPPREDLPR